MLEAAFVLGVVTATDPSLAFRHCAQGHTVGWLQTALLWDPCFSFWGGAGEVLSPEWQPAQLLPPYVTWEPPAEGLSQT